MARANEPIGRNEGEILRRRSQARKQYGLRFSIGQPKAARPLVGACEVAVGREAAGNCETAGG